MRSSLKPKLSRKGIGFSLRQPRLAFLLLTGRLSYEEVLQELLGRDLELLRNRIGSVLPNKGFHQMPQESVEETLRLISPSKKESSFGRLNRWHSFLYAITRSVLPATVVETGVLYGHSSAAILAALEDNGAGRLISVDLPAEKHQTVTVGKQYVQIGIAQDRLSIGSAVPVSLRSRWTLQLGNSLDVLPMILDDVAPISIFIHDSLHTYDHMSAEFRLGYDALEPGGILVSDDIDYNSAWSDFCFSKGENWRSLSKGSGTSERFGFLIKSDWAGRAVDRSPR
jgi:hypothetical protein